VKIAAVIRATKTMPAAMPFLRVNKRILASFYGCPAGESYFTE
jgi:hypothetical protein